jgi:hypothetical protein
VNPPPPSSIFSLFEKKKSTHIHIRLFIFVMCDCCYCFLFFSGDDTMMLSCVACVIQFFFVCVFSHYYYCCYYCILNVCMFSLSFCFVSFFLLLSSLEKKLKLVFKQEHIKKKVKHIGRISCSLFFFCFCFYNYFIDNDRCKFK